MNSPAELTAATACPASPALPEPKSFEASDGYEIRYRLWSPAGPVRGVVVALHGIQSHSGWFGYSSRRLADRGFAVAFLDRRGSGLNSRDRGDVPAAERWKNDVVQFAAELDRSELSGLPKILLAVSWGGKLATVTAVDHVELFAGLALLYPALKTRIRANLAQRLAVRTAVRLGGGARRVAIPLSDPKLFTAEPQYQQFIASDRLALHEVSLRFLNATFDLDAAIADPKGRLTLPLFVALAGEDRIVDNAATLTSLQAISDGPMVMVEYPEARHTLEFEPQRDAFLAELAAWLESLCPA